MNNSDLDISSIVEENKRLQESLAKMKSQISVMSMFTNFYITLLKVTDIEKAISILVVQLCKIVGSYNVKVLRKESNKTSYCYYAIEKGGIKKSTILKENLGRDGLFIYCNSIKIGDEDNPFLAIPIKYEGENLAAIKFENIEHSEIKEIDINLIELISLVAGVVIKNCLLKEESLIEKNLIIEKNNKINNELKYAQNIQNLIISSGYQHISQYKIYCKHEEAEYLCGDFYEVFKTSRGNIVFYMADVSGHGVASSLLTVFFKQKLNDIIVEACKMEMELKPSYILKKLQSSFSSFNLNNELYIGIVLGIIDLQTNVVTLANAGHNVEPLKVTKQGIFPVEIEGFPINNWFDDDFEDDYEEKMFYFNAGDSLILLSDGAIEVKKNGQVFGLENIKNLLKESKNKDFHVQYENIINEIKFYSNKTSLDDDVAYLAIIRKE